jgi:hypothetical protein
MGPKKKKRSSAGRFHLDFFSPLEDLINEGESLNKHSLAHTNEELA